MSQFQPICLYCKHYDRDSEEEDTCDAFLKGIPAKFLEGEADHFKPEPEDNGIQFEVAKDMDTPEVRAFLKRRKKNNG